MSSPRLLLIQKAGSVTVRIFLLLFYLCQRTLFCKESEIFKCAQKDSSNKQEETYISVILLFPAVEFPIKILSSHK